MSRLPETPDAHLGFFLNWRHVAGAPHPLVLGIPAMGYICTTGGGERGEFGVVTKRRTEKRVGIFGGEGRGKSGGGGRGKIAREARSPKGEIAYVREKQPKGDDRDLI